MFCKGPLKKTQARRGGEDFDDDRPGGDPAGATFEETLEERWETWESPLLIFTSVGWPSKNGGKTTPQIIPF